MQPAAMMTPNTAAASSSSTTLVLGSRLCITAHTKQFRYNTSLTPELGFIYITLIFVVRYVSLAPCWVPVFLNKFV